MTERIYRLVATIDLNKSVAMTARQAALNRFEDNDWHGKSASEEYSLSEPIHFRKRIKTLCLAIHLARGVAIVRKPESTTKYRVARTKTAD
jgi:hypothetical protein